MLHVAAVLFFASAMALGVAVIAAILAEERHAILGALMMRPAGAPVALPQGRFTEVRYSARIRPQAVRQAAFRAAA